jgi:GR25 family glycosyltransferase involved in LPS biosynthesis
MPLKKHIGMNDRRQVTTSYWDYFDKIYCISLAQRTDRHAAAKRQFEHVGLTGKVEFIIVGRHPHNRMQGNYESHMACMQKALQAGAETIAIFEDDILFEGFRPTQLKNGIDFLAANPDCDILFFGCLVSGSRKTANNSMRKIKFRCLTHGYALPRRYAEELVKIPWRGIAFDDMLRDLAAGFYAIYPAFAFQSNAASDNDSCRRLERLRRLWGGLRRIQKANEFYHRHKIMVIAVHIVLVLIFLKLVLPI